MVEAIVALGSNLGDREHNLRQAVIGITGGNAAKAVAASSVYETEPMYYEDQGWFLNCVVAVETALGPRKLLERLQRVEKELGRQPGERYGPRVIDLDILFYGDEVVSEPGLEIPHPRLAERRFVLVPLNEIRPNLVHPVLKKKVSDLLARLGTGKRVVVGSDFLADLLTSERPRPSES